MSGESGAYLPVRNPLRVLSYGGGTQSAALALMSAAGQLPKLDAVVFADTQGELPETYAYAKYVEGHLDAAGIPFFRVTAGSLEATLRSPVITQHNPTPPAHVLNPDGTKGRIGAYRCSYDFKRRVIQRQTKQLTGGRGAWKLATVEQWIGFSTDEMSRMKQDTECRCGHLYARHSHQTGCGAPKCRCEGFLRWRTNRWPLIELGFRRGDTIRWFRENGHPVPPRSACWFCPNGGNARWRSLKAEHPDLFERACTLDEHIREGGAFNARGSQPFAGRMFLHDSLMPLREADLRSKAEIEQAGGQEALFDEDALATDCNAGVCFT